MAGNQKRKENQPPRGGRPTSNMPENDGQALSPFADLTNLQGNRPNLAHSTSAQSYTAQPKKPLPATDPEPSSKDNDIMATPELNMINADAQPPYEEPRDMRYPSHFDDSAELRNYQTLEEDDDILDARDAIDEDMFKSQWVLATTASFHISISRAITGAARALNPLQPASTPLFIEVSIAEGNAGKIKEIHEGLVELVRRHFPVARFSDHPGLTTPIVRYFTNYDAAFMDDGA